MTTIRQTKTYQHFVNMLNNRADEYILREEKRESLLREIYAKCTSEAHYAAATVAIGDYIGWNIMCIAANGIMSKALEYHKPGTFCKSGRMSDAQINTIVGCAAESGDIWRFAKKLGIELKVDEKLNLVIVAEE